MTVKIEVNGQVLQAHQGAYLLDILRANGIKIPTLCSIEGLPPTGACRLCVVEIEGVEDLVPACSYPIEDPIVVYTHSGKVIRARRTILELLVAGHPDDCLYCHQSFHCELNNLAQELNITERKTRFKKPAFKKDQSSHSLTHDPTKCVLCGRCIRICDEQRVSAIEFIGRGTDLRIGTSGDRGLAHSTCISCGQCIQACPTGSFSESSQLEELLLKLQQKDQELMVLIDPAVVVSVGQEVGHRAGKDMSGLLYAALRRIGIDKVFSGSEMADAMLLNTAKAWTERLDQRSPIGILSFCPAWISFLEKTRPDLLPMVLPVQRPAQLFGRMMREADSPAYLIQVTTCTASKAESQEIRNSQEGRPYIDCVISTRELVQLLRIYGIDFERIEPEVPDTVYNGAGFSYLLSGVSGGLLEGLARALHLLDSDQFLVNARYPKLRGQKKCKVIQMDQYQPAQQWIACSSHAEAIRLIDRQSDFEGPMIYEVLSCPGGCINGGGQTGHADDKTNRNQIKEVYDADQGLSDPLTHLAGQMLKMTEGIEKLVLKTREEKDGLYK